MAGPRQTLEDVDHICGDIFIRDSGNAGSILESLNVHYDAVVRHVDDLLGCFVDDLRGTAIMDNTLLVVVSDHGESLGERNWIGHNLMHVQQLFVPWIMRGPGLPRGKVVEDRAQLVDLVPTLLDYLGLSNEHYLSGISLMSAVKGRDNQTEERLRVCESGRGRALLRGPWILEQSNRAPELLYRFDLDPLARRNKLHQQVQLRNDLVEEYRALLVEHGIVPGARKEEQVIPDEQTLEKLRSLGYVN